MDDQRTDRKGGDIITRLNIAAVIVAVGLSIVVGLINSFDHLNWPQHERLLGWIASLLWLAGGIMIGAGVLFPFRLTALGALIGFSVQLVLLLDIVEGLHALSRLN